ncbi:MAG: phenylalanine--tRNA ligase subunit beta [Thiolinea sp.]
MYISEQWLREWVNPEQDFAAIGEVLTVSGCEVESLDPVATAFTDIVVGELVEVDSHPDADKLRVCRVNAGGEELLQIVCGAPNARVGLKAPLARIGAQLPMPEGKPLKIKKGKLRGVESFGMLCSASELGMADKSDGLLELPADAPVGTAVRDYLQLDDQVLELSITPNRGDCLGVAGVAREVGVLTGTAVNVPEIPAQDVKHDEALEITLPAADVCPHFVGRVIRNVNAKAETPLWMQEKLRRHGLRSLSAAVDVTNYVMLEIGKPIHAYDLDTLDGGIQARYAEAGEQLELLDGQTLTLQADAVVIADDKKAVGFAGIMGGNSTAVNDDTQNIFLESAHFRPQKMAGQARKYGMQTDASYRFERGVATDLTRPALERATALIIEICGGEAGPVTDCCADDALFERTAIKLRRERIGRILGVSMDDADVVEILERLGCAVSATDDGWSVQAPLSRFDLSIEEDLVEELARVRGYDSIPEVLRPLPPVVTLPLETQNRLDMLRRPLIEAGYQEAVTYSFVDPELEVLLNEQATDIRLANPISSDLSRMRTTLWTGLLPAVKHNLNRQQNRVRLFEVGPAFDRQNGNIVQTKRIAGVITGAVLPEQWGADDRKVDFYDVKGDVEAILGQASANAFTFRPATHPALHPGQSAEICCGEEAIGWVGALHPRIEASLGLGQAVYLFELDMAALNDKKLPEYQAVAKFPGIRRDLALLVDQSVLASTLDKVIADVAPAQLVRWNVFDVYTGKGVEAHQKSVALSLILQDFSRTLEDSEVNQVVEKVVASLKEETGATLR